MAKISELTTLFRAISDGDIERANRLADQIADSKAQSGMTKAAKRLRSALSTPGLDLSPQGQWPVASTGVSSSPPVARLPTGVQMGDVILAEQARTTLLALIREHTHADRLASAGLTPVASILLHGPPGCGKTYSIRAVAHALGLPLFVVRFDALFGSYLGQTALRLRDVFEFAQRQPCVLLLDELDAVGRRRGSSEDVGELNRVVVSLMQLMDEPSNIRLVAAASNLMNELDPALVRRFEMVVEIDAPDQERLNAYIESECVLRNVTLSAARKRPLLSCNSFADVRTQLIADHKAQVLDGLT